MRFARVRAGTRRRAVWGVELNRSWKGPRPNRPSPETPDGDRNRDPRKDRYKSIPEKRPSAATNRGKSSGLLRPTPLAPPVTAEGSQKVTLPIQPMCSNPIASR
jgi:hypothetical protein